MIYSPEHEFLFIKTRKTAGSAIDVALSQIAGGDAVVTKLSPPEHGYRPRNHTRIFDPTSEVGRSQAVRTRSAQARRDTA